MELSGVLFNLMHAVRNEMMQQVKLLDLNLSPMHFKSLKVISKIDQCTGQKLATWMGRDKAQINRLIKELVTQDLVVKVNNIKDKRSQILALSSKGETIMEKFNIAEKQIFNNMIAGISLNQLENFIEVANKLTENLHQ